MKTYEIIISGRVQGVGYRNYAKTIAQDLNVNGTVTNRSDGNVLVIAQTNETTLEKFVNKLQQPQHQWMRIDEVKQREISSEKEFNNFKINY